MPLSRFQLDLTIAMGVMSALALCMSAFQASTWLRRQGNIAVDCATMLKFVLLACGNLASAFTLVLLGFTLWWLIFYKVYAML